MQVSFGRAVRVKTIVEPDSNAAKQFDNKTITHSIVSTIMGESIDSICTKEQAEAMGNFLRAQLGDCSKNSAMCMKKIGDNNYLFTGEDAYKAHDILCSATTEHIQLDNIAKHDKNLKGTRLLEERHKQIEKKCKSKLSEILENGFDGKPNSYIRVVASKGDDSKDKFQIFYSSMSHGDESCTNTETSISV